MTGITGGPDTLMEHDARADRAGLAMGVRAGSTEAAVLDGVVACAARWGIDKTTVDDVAREAGVSRATVYRLFPGGKSAMVQLSTRREVISMLMGLHARIERCENLGEAVFELLHGGSTMVSEQAAIAYMRTHEPNRLRAFFSFARLDGLFKLSADVLAPSMQPFVDAATARECVIWSARLVVSHFLTPDPDRDLTDPAFARRLAQDHVMVGLQADRSPTGAPVDRTTGAPRTAPTNPFAPTTQETMT